MSVSDHRCLFKLFNYFTTLKYLVLFEYLPATAREFSDMTSLHKVPPLKGLPIKLITTLSASALRTSLQPCRLRPLRRANI
jgi:hypothetical protein